MVFLKSILILVSIIKIFTQNSNSTISTSKSNCFLLGAPNINVIFYLNSSPSPL